MMYSYGPRHMAVQKQDDQHEHTFSNYVRIRDVVQKTCLRRWTIGKSGERGSGIYVLPARHDDDMCVCVCVYMCVCVFGQHFFINTYFIMWLVKSHCWQPIRGHKTYDMRSCFGVQIQRLEMYRSLPHAADCRSKMLTCQGLIKW